MADCSQSTNSESTHRQTDPASFHSATETAAQLRVSLRYSCYFILSGHDMRFIRSEYLHNVLKFEGSLGFEINK